MFVKRVIGVGGDVVKIERQEGLSQRASRCLSLMRNSNIPRRLPLRDDFPPSLSSAGNPSRRLGT